MSLSLGQKLKNIEIEQNNEKLRQERIAEEKRQKEINRKVSWIRKILNEVKLNIEKIATHEREANFYNGRLNVGTTKNSGQLYTTFMLNANDMSITEHFRKWQDELGIHDILNEFDSWMKDNDIQKIELAYQYSHNNAWNDIWLTPNP